MIPISQRLRARLEPVGDGSGKWRPDGLCQEAADVVDALVEALEGVKRDSLAADFNEHWDSYKAIAPALAKAKGKQE